MKQYDYAFFNIVSLFTIRADALINCGLMRLTSDRMTSWLWNFAFSVAKDPIEQTEARRQ